MTSVWLYVFQEYSSWAVFLISSSCWLARILIPYMLHSKEMTILLERPHKVMLLVKRDHFMVAERLNVMLQNTVDDWSNIFITFFPCWFSKKRSSISGSFFKVQRQVVDKSKLFLSLDVRSSIFNHFSSLEAERKGPLLTGWTIGLWGNTWSAMHLQND